MSASYYRPGDEPEDKHVIHVTTQAQRWLKLANDMLPDGQTIVWDVRVCRVLHAASLESGNCGPTGIYFMFADGSKIQSTRELDRIMGGRRV